MKFAPLDTFSRLRTVSLVTRSVGLKQKHLTLMVSLGVRFPKTKFNTVSTATELVERHPGRSRVHAVVPIEPAKRIASAIHVVDTIVLNLHRLVVPDPISGHGLISPRSFDRRFSLCLAAPVIYSITGGHRSHAKDKNCPSISLKYKPT